MQLHCDTIYQNLQVRHWIKVSRQRYAASGVALADWTKQILMRLSNLDAEGLIKRSHCQIFVEFPFQILSCQATQGKISLPAYTTSQAGPSPH